MDLPSTLISLDMTVHDIPVSVVHNVTTAHSLLSSVPHLDADNVAFHLNKCNFPPAKWTHLAVGLKQADAISTIEANRGDVAAHLVSLITHWVANDLEKTWEKLVDAVVISKEMTIAIQLAKDVGVPSPGTLL